MLLSAEHKAVGVFSKKAKKYKMILSGKKSELKEIHLDEVCTCVHLDTN